MQGPNHTRPHPDVLELIEDVTQLVSLPEVHYRLEAALAAPTASLKEVAEVLGTDPDLTARLLSLANSAFYGLPAKIESVSHALVTIGTRQLNDLVLATVVVRLFSQLPVEAVNMKAFWRHCLHVGLLSRGIARCLGEPNDSRFYTVGLLHDIGRLLLYLKRPGDMHELLMRARTEKRPDYALEREHFGFDHAELGAALLCSWRLPAAICEPVRCHHGRAGGAYAVEAAVLTWANILSNCLTDGEAGMEMVSESAAAALAGMGVGAAQLARIVEEAGTQLAATEDALSR